MVARWRGWNLGAEWTGRRRYRQSKRGGLRWREFFSDALCERGGRGVGWCVCVCGEGKEVGM